MKNILIISLLLVGGNLYSQAPTDTLIRGKRKNVFYEQRTSKVIATYYSSVGNDEKEYKDTCTLIEKRKVKYKPKNQIYKKKVWKRCNIICENDDVFIENLISLKKLKK